MYICLSLEYGMKFYCYFEVLFDGIVIRKISLNYRE